MGGIAFILATIAAYFLSKLITGYPPTYSGLLVLGLMFGMGLVGFLDDYIKIVKRRSLGLRAKAKMAGQLIVGIAFAVLSLQFSDARGNTPASTKLSFITDFGWSIGPVLFVVWALFMILAMSNGVNLTDGLDGLATGASVLVFGAYTFIGVWQFQESCANAGTLTNPGACYEVRDPLDLAVVASALMGACLASCGGTPRPPRSSWATPVRSPSAASSPAWPSSPARSCWWPSWAACSSSSPCRSSSRSVRSGSPASASSGWRRSSTTSNSRAGPKSWWWSASGSSRASV